VIAYHTLKLPDGPGKTGLSLWCVSGFDVGENLNRKLTEKPVLSLFASRGLPLLEFSQEFQSIGIEAGFCENLLPPP
jgi:hypothetical protein